MKCVQNRTDCIFNNGKECEILKDTRLKRPCPFLKKGRRMAYIDDIHVKGYAGVFRSIIGFEGVYYVDEDGRVYGARSKKLLHWKRKSKDEVPYVVLIKDDGYTTIRRIDRLVADAFIGGSGEVEHKDGDPSNCNVWNLKRAQK